MVQRILTRATLQKNDITKEKTAAGTTELSPKQQRSLPKYRKQQRSLPRHEKTAAITAEIPKNSSDHCRNIKKQQRSPPSYHKNSHGENKN